MPLRALQTGAPLLRCLRRTKTPHHIKDMRRSRQRDEKDHEKGGRIGPGNPDREHETKARAQVREIARKLARLSSGITPPYYDTRLDHNKQDYEVEKDRHSLLHGVELHDLVIQDGGKGHPGDIPGTNYRPRRPKQPIRRRHHSMFRDWHHGPRSVVNAPIPPIAWATTSKTLNILWKNEEARAVLLPKSGEHQVTHDNASFDIADHRPDG